MSAAKTGQPVVAIPEVRAPWNTLVVASLLLLMPLCASGWQQQRKRAAGSVADTRLQSMVRSGRLDDLRWPDFPDYRVHVDEFYRPAQYSFAWIVDGKPSARARQV